MKKKASDEIQVPSMWNWRTTDEDEVNRRRLRAKQEQARVENLYSQHTIFSNFRVQSSSKMVYEVEIRDLAQRQFSCTCVDFRVNGLGTCKHVESVLLYLQTCFAKKFSDAIKKGSERIDVVLDDEKQTLRVERNFEKLPDKLRKLFNEDGILNQNSPEEAIGILQKSDFKNLRLSQEIASWLEARKRAEERKFLRREYEQKVQAGIYPQHETLMPLFPYQREGMLHLAFTERALLADEMGLGKTIQAIAACVLLHRIGKASRVLVVTPASLKTEWEEQIQRFTNLPYQLVFGRRADRLKKYLSAPFFTLVNYEQMLADTLDVNARLKPDIIVLDEAQRIKNWSTKTAQAIKRLQSRYAFVLTGTPIENRIDELYSIMGFLDPSLFGPLFRFNRDYYILDEKGKPKDYQNLDKLHERIKPLMIRRRKADVETELPARSDKNFFVEMSDSQRASYKDHEQEVSKLLHIARRRPLTQQQQDKLMRELAMMRMICDTNFILDDEDKICPKLKELEKIFEECLEDKDVKIIIFSEWERMLILARELCQRMKIGYAWHTGSVPQQRRRGEIRMFKENPDCRIFLSTDSGGVGLNLQNASVVINCDLPWNPAKLEQRIARAWRKHQTRHVTVLNLVARDSIEEKMLGTLAAKKGLADGVLDKIGDLKEISLKRGSQAFLSKLEQLMTPVPEEKEKTLTPTLPADRSLVFSQKCAQMLNGSFVVCEEKYLADKEHSLLLVVVDRDPETWRARIQSAYQELFGDGNIATPVELQIISQSTQQELQRLAELGLITLNVRATRHLHPPMETASSLTDEEKQKIQHHQTLAARKLKAAKILINEELLDESRPALLDALHNITTAHSLRHKLPLPPSPDFCLQPPWNTLWQDRLITLQNFIPSTKILFLLESKMSVLNHL